MVFGASLELASEVALRLVAVLVILITLIWFVTGMIRIVFRLLHPHASTWVQAILNWSRVHPRFGEIAAALADPDHPEAKGLAILASLLILTTGLFAVVFYGVAGGSKFAGLDWMVLQGLQSLRTPWADHLMLVFTYLADTRVVAALILAVLAFLFLKRHNRTLVHWLAAAAFGLLASPILKYSLQIPRPDLGIVAVGPYAFPSAHVMRAAVLYGFLAVIIARALTARWRWLAYGTAGLLILLVTLSRLYLGVHWLSDVLGSLTLGLAWVAALGIAYNRHIDVETRWRGLTLCATATLALALGLQAWRYQAADLARYTPARPTQQMRLEVWWTQGWNQLPQRREDIHDSRRQPLNIQYAGTLDALEASLVQRGWKRAQTLNWENSLKLLSPSASLQELPLLPQVHDGRHEVLALERYPTPEDRLVLRLWSTDLVLQPGDIGVWQGNVSSQQKTQVLSLFAFPSTRPDFSQPYALFLNDIQQLTQRQPDRVLELVLVRSDRNPNGNPLPSAAPDFRQ
jgi:undecaprenyl-diphosphatase